MIKDANQEISVKLWAEIVIFISSYFPLFLILYIRDINDCVGLEMFYLGSGIYVRPVAVGALFVSGICFLIVSESLSRVFSGKRGGEPVVIIASSSQKGDMINYTIPFLIGLFAFNYSDIQNIASLVVFLVFMFAFIKKNESIFFNPMLLLLGIRLYQVEYQHVGSNLKQIECALCKGIPQKSSAIVNMKVVVGIRFLFK
ncbi:hypothetical protein KV201_10795 [Shewanella sp. SR1]|uniref:hypothetical protein n=1 Tax=Shewanella TaxID=22 RepID=UPI001CF39522|nr:hypothetical protein [Shewanella sp. SR1]MCB2382662.1 hypothetical protein [Shewanella sp. SR1]